MNLESTSFGATWTHVGPAGWYFDALVMGQCLDGSARSLRGVGIGANGSGFAASLEGGYPFLILPDLSLEPQAQILWQRFDPNDGFDAFSSVAFGSSSLATARLGLRLQGVFATNAVEWRPYLLASLWHDFDATSTLAVCHHTDLDKA